MTAHARHARPHPMLMRFMVGASAEIVAGCLHVFFPDATTAVDLTPGRGCFWDERAPVRVAVTLSPHDFTALPYADAEFDVALIDPPHLGDLGTRSIMGPRFGTFKAKDLEPAMRAGVREAWRVARLGVLAKVTDHVHESRFVRQSGWIIEELGEPFDVVHGTRSPLVDGKWRDPQLSARSNGASYLMFRRGSQKHERWKALVGHG